MADSDAATQLSLAHASAGSGSTSHPSRTSAPNLLFAIPLLLLSLSLLTLSRRFVRLRSTVGLGLCAALFAWDLTVSRQGDTYLAGADSSLNATKNDLVIWGITAALFALASIFGASPLWPLGIAALSVAAGFAWALSFLLLGKHALIPSQGGRWGWLAAWALVSLALLAFIKPKYRHWVELGQACMTGAFLFSLSIDLLANGASGASIGLRYILDTNSYHLAVLSYTPKLSTQLLMALSWIVAPALAYFQYRLFRQPQPWPSHTWFQGEEDEGTDQSASASATPNSDSQDTLNGTGQLADPEKATDEMKDGFTMSNENIVNPVTSTNIATISSKTRRLTMSAGNDVSSRAPMVQQLRRPLPTAALPRSNSFPQASHMTRLSTASSESSAARLRPQRNSSAYPLPSLSQLMASDDDEQRQRQAVVLAQTGSNYNRQIGPDSYHTWFTPSPPSSRSNSRRNSAMLFNNPPILLGSHEEIPSAEENLRLVDEKLSQSDSQKDQQSDISGEVLWHTSIPAIHIADADEVQRTEVAQTKEEEHHTPIEERKRTTSSLTNITEHSVVSSILTTTTTFGSLSDVEPDPAAIPAGTLINISPSIADQDVQEESASCSSDDTPVSVPMEGGTHTNATSSSASSVNLNNVVGEGSENEEGITRNTSSSSLQTSVSAGSIGRLSTEISKADSRSEVPGIQTGSRSPLLRYLYQHTGTRGEEKVLYLDSVKSTGSLLHGSIIAHSKFFVSCQVRITLNDWKTFLDIPAKPSNIDTDGDRRENDEGIEEWIFSHRIDESNGTNTLQLALCAVDEKGRETWDSNGGMNYRIDV